MKQIDDLRERYAKVIRHDQGTCACHACGDIRIAAARMLPTFFDIFEAAQQLVNLGIGVKETQLRDTMAKVKQF